MSFLSTTIVIFSIIISFIFLIMSLIDVRCCSSGGVYLYCSAVLNSCDHYDSSNHDLFCPIGYVCYQYMRLYSLLKILECQLNVIHYILSGALFLSQQLEEILSTQSIFYINALNIVAVGKLFKHITINNFHPQFQF